MIDKKCAAAAGATSGAIAFGNQVDTRDNDSDQARDRAIAAKCAEIDRLYKEQRRKRHRGRASLRIAEMCRLFADRYGHHGLPDDDAGRDDLLVVAHHLARLHQTPELLGRISSWASLHAPWLTPDEAKALADEVEAKPLSWRADTLAWRLGLRQADRLRLRIRTIGAVDVNRAQRLALRKQKDKESHTAKRRAKGARPQAESAEHNKPWLTLGMKRSSWYAKGKPTNGEQLGQIRRQYNKSLCIADETVQADSAANVAPPPIEWRARRNPQTGEAIEIIGVPKWGPISRGFARDDECFEGDWFRLSKAQLERLHRQFPAVEDLIPVLAVIDAYYACNPPISDRGFMFRVKAWLKKENRKAAKRQRDEAYSRDWG